MNSNKIQKNFGNEYKERKTNKMDMNFQNSKENEDINIKLNNNNIRENKNNIGTNNYNGMSYKSLKSSNIKKKNDIFDPERKIIKRNPSAKQNKVSKFNIFKRNNDNDNDNNYINGFLPKAIHKLSTPGVIGLSNKGGFSCINAVIQCLSNILRLRIELISNGFYKELENNKTNKTKLSFYFAEVLKNLWENLNQRIYDHKNFINILYNMNQNFNKDYDEPKKIINFLFDKIHKELNKPKSNNNELSLFLFQNNNKYKMDFNSFKLNFENKNNSIITKEFNGYSNHINGCFNCSLKLSETFENFEILNFSLDEIRKFKKYNFNYVNIYECFEYYQRKEYLPSNCYNCGKNIINFKELLIMPQTLIINFEYQNFLQNSVNVVFEEYLNLKNYIRFNNNSPYYYELIGVICSINSNEKRNHYISYCKNIDNCEWYQYNDDKVTKSSFKEISCQPHILFFSYMQN